MTDVDLDHSAGTWGLGGDLPIRRLAFGAMRITGRGIWGEPDDHDESIATLRARWSSGSTSSTRPTRTARMSASVSSPRRCTPTRTTSSSPRRAGSRAAARISGARTGGPNICAPRATGVSSDFGWTRSRCTSSIVPIRRCPLADSIGALQALKDEGKIRHIGVCNVDDDQLGQALALTPVVSVQNRYGHGDRSSESVLDRCEQERLAFLPWAPLGGGTMSDPVVDRIATAHGASARQVALAWLLARSPVMVPIPGTSSVAHLEENVAAANVSLTPEEVGELNRV